MKKFVLAAAVVASVSVMEPGPAVLAEELTRHTVKRGDTLWDLSEGYLADPFLWPEIWKINPGIANPHLIYPGQVFRIPLAVPPLVRVAAPAEPAAAGPDLDELARRMGLSGGPLGLRAAEREPAAAVVEPGKDDMELARQYDRGIGMVTREIPEAGLVLGTEQGWGKAAVGETVLVNAPGAEAGRRFGVYRDMGKVKPLTFLGESPGHLLADIAIVEVVAGPGPEQRAVVRRSFSALQKGDLLGPEPEQPAMVTPSSARDAVPVTGTVLAIHHMRGLAGPGDIVYIDRGSRQGLAPGLRLSVRSADSLETTRTAGEIMVLRASGDRAAALVTGKSNHEVRPGDLIGPAL